ncbi:MAG TPA: hypothetical protein PLD84_05010 [Chitinophagales bacterium]|nr:hypothetical protein [Chitinophagales bacterium]
MFPKITTLNNVLRNLPNIAATTTIHSRALVVNHVLNASNEAVIFFQPDGQWVWKDLL